MRSRATLLRSPRHALQACACRVAQTSSLREASRTSGLYRRFPICGRNHIAASRGSPAPHRGPTPCRLEVGDTAGWKPALQVQRRSVVYPTALAVCSGPGLVWLLLLLICGQGRAQAPQPSEYQIKAAFLFNFAKFVQWPPAAFAEATSPIVIGVLGENPFHDDLARTIRDKTVDDHPLVVKEFLSPSQATNCHILFISSSEKARLPEILQRLKGTSVLTVGETDRFTEFGGMINFVLERTKIRFQINNAAATKAGLKISSKLLSLALRPGG